ncbi:hypothetical protein IGJ02_003167 [Enterococcus sp. DIV0724b]|uniref:thioredoxin family protein n=1 Tax=Enterococcus sp. DIV0724b TaxID=2774694 RepID=UPI003D2FF2C1
MRKKILGILIILAMFAAGSFCFSQLSFSKGKEAFISVNEQEVVKAIKDKQDMIVYYGQDSCGACRVFQPTLTEAIKTTKKKVYFLDGDNFSTKKFSEKYNITGTPTMIVIKKGEVLRFEGVMELAETIETLESI